MFKFVTDYHRWMKLICFISFFKNSIWRFLPVKIIAHLGIYACPSKHAFITCLSKMLGPLNKETFSKVDNHIKSDIINLANDILKHNFQLLGSSRQCFTSGHIQTISLYL